MQLCLINSTKLHNKQYRTYKCFSSGLARVITVPEGPPISIQVYNATWNSLNISWLPPEQPNGIITKYEVKIYEPSSNLTNITETNDQSGSMNKHIYFTFK